ncbi:MAG: hypothetical protein M3Z31_10015 [Pseudomonadota bacterium]|nr:hypothetical protein [Pseudomonadota bacterium]
MSGKRISPSLDASLGVAVEHRRGRSDGEPEVPGYSTRVFDLRGRSAFVRLGYAVDEHLFITGELAVRRGQVESTAQQGYAIFSAADAIAEDHAFGDASLYAYRVHATTASARLTASWALSDRASVNPLYADNRARAAYDLAYTDRSLGVSIIFRYP